MFIKIYFRKSFVQQLERSFDKSAQNFLLKIRSFSAQRHNFFFSKVFFLIRSMHLLKHLRNRSFKVRKKFVQRTEPLSTIFLSNYSKEVVEWNFGIPYKTVSAKPERYARTFQENLEHFVRLDIYNAGSTIYRKLQFKHHILKKITQECGIENLIYSFNDNVEKLLRRIEKLSGWTPTTFSRKVLHFMKNAVSLKTAEHCSFKARQLFCQKIPLDTWKEVLACVPNFFSRTPKNLCSNWKNITKMFLRPSELKFWRLWQKRFCWQMTSIIKAIAEKQFSQLVRLNSL